MSFRDEMVQAAAAYGISLSDRQLEQFEQYFVLLMNWNQKMNLTAITEPHEVAVKHMIDSLSVYDAALFPVGLRLIDVGTGAGFPGIPLKILRPDLRLTLLDSLNKRVRFLETVVQELGLKDVVCLHARAEEAARQKIYREQFDMAVSRAVARLPVLAEYTLPFVKSGGIFAAMKGMKYQEEADAATHAIRVLGGGAMRLAPVKLPGLEDVRAVIYIEKKGKTPAAYPRKAGIPEKNPL